MWHIDINALPTYSYALRSQLCRDPQSNENGVGFISRQKKEYYSIRWGQKHIRGWHRVQCATKQPMSPGSCKTKLPVQPRGLPWVSLTLFLFAPMWDIILSPHSVHHFKPNYEVTTSKA